MRLKWFLWVKPDQNMAECIVKWGIPCFKTAWMTCYDTMVLGVIQLKLFFFFDCSKQLISFSFYIERNDCHLRWFATLNAYFEIPCIKRLESAYVPGLWQKDPESDIHTPELYAIWNSKPCLMEAIAKENPFNSEFIIWVDAGSFRHQ